MCTSEARVTSIDTILSNGEAAHGVQGIQRLWNRSQGMDHLALQVTIDDAAYSEQVTKFTQPAVIPIPKASPQNADEIKTHKHEIASKFTTNWAPHKHAFQKALRCEDLDEMSNLWRHVCEHTLIEHFQSNPAQASSKPPRGQTLLRHSEDLAARFDTVQNQSATRQTTTIQKHINRLRDLKQRIRRWLTPTNEEIGTNYDDHTLTLDTTTQQTTNNRRQIKPADLRDTINLIHAIAHDTPL